MLENLRNKAFLDKFVAVPPLYKLFKKTTILNHLKNNLIKKVNRYRNSTEMEYYRKQLMYIIYTSLETSVLDP